METNTNTTEKEELIEIVIAEIINGKDRGEINKIILHLQPNFSLIQVEEIINSAFEKINDIMTETPEYIVGRHLELYERIYKYFEEIKNAPGMAKAMKAKERLVGLLNSNKISITQTNTTVLERKVEYDESKLTPTELDRFKELLNKASS